MKTCNRLARIVARAGQSKTNLISLTMSDDLLKAGILDMTDHIESVSIFLPSDIKKELTKDDSFSLGLNFAYDDDAVYVAINGWTGDMVVSNKTDEELTIYFDVCLGNHNRR